MTNVLEGTTAVALLSTGKNVAKAKEAALLIWIVKVTGIFMVLFILVYVASLCRKLNLW